MANYPARLSLRVFLRSYADIWRNRRRITSKAKSKNQNPLLGIVAWRTSMRMYCAADRQITRDRALSHAPDGGDRVFQVFPRRLWSCRFLRFRQFDAYLLFPEREMLRVGTPSCWVSSSNITSLASASFCREGPLKEPSGRADLPGIFFRTGLRSKAPIGH